MIKSFKINPIYILFLVILGCIFGCKSIMYLPNMQNVPMFKGKNEFQLSGTFLNYQTAYSVTNYLGLEVNAYSNKLIPFTWGLSDMDPEYNADRFCYEGGAVFYKKIKEWCFLDIATGYGKGYCTFTYRDPPDYRRLGNTSNFKKFYIQPSIYFPDNLLSISVSCRISGINFYNLKVVPNNDGIPANRNVLFIEPAITIKSRTDRAISVFGQIQSSQYFGNLSNPGLYEYDAYCSIGLELNINRIVIHRIF
jgi:hypothetical protein